MNRLMSEVKRARPEVKKAVSEAKRTRGGG